MVHYYINQRFVSLRFSPVPRFMCHTIIACQQPSTADSGAGTVVHWLTELRASPQRHIGVCISSSHAEALDG